MAQNKVKWEDMYPNGFLACFSMRRMPKSLHKRIKRLALEKGLPQELVVVLALEEGVAMEEMRVFTQ